MRRLLLLMVCLLPGCCPAPVQVSDNALIGTTVWRNDPALFRIEVRALDIEERLYMVHAESIIGWWSYFLVAGIDADDAIWFTRRDIDEQAVRRMETVALPQTANRVIELWAQTHMGNGNLYLFELRGRTLNPLLETFAVDEHRDLTLIRGGELKADYADLNGDGAADLKLTGYLDLYDDRRPDTAPPSSGTPCQKVFYWRDGSFVEDRNQRIGFGMYGDLKGPTIHSRPVRSFPRPASK